MNKYLFTLLALSFSCSQLWSQQVQLKTSFWGGVQYSLDGGEFETVDRDGGELRTLMNENEKCIEYLDRFKSNTTLAAVAGVPGGVLVGWPIGGYLGSGGEWKKSYTIMLVIGVPLATLSTILENKAKSNLEQAVAIYNKEKLGFLSNFKLSYNYHKTTRDYKMSIKYHYLF
jgi:hypothetical protein